MGSISVDGPGQHNLDRSEDPWGNTGNRMHGGAPAHRVARLRTRYRRGQRGARRAEANRTTRAEFAVDGKAPSEIPAFQPDWRKSAVRNDRGDDGNGGIIRSPIRAIVLPDNSQHERNTTRQRRLERDRRTAAHDSDLGYDVTGSEVHGGRIANRTSRGARGRREGTV